MRSAYSFFGLCLILNSAILSAQTSFCNADSPVPYVIQRASDASQQTDTKTRDRILEAYENFPPSFDANQGQTDSRVKFLSRGRGYTLFLTSDEAVFSLNRGQASIALDETFPADPRLSTGTFPTSSTVLLMKLVKANPSAEIAGEDELRAKTNYFIGKERNA